jgi:hypothetical protein
MKQASVRGCTQDAHLSHILGWKTACIGNPQLVVDPNNQRRPPLSGDTEGIRKSQRVLDQYRIYSHVLCAGTAGGGNLG